MNLTYKIILVGSTSVGKSSYICRVSRGVFASNTGATIGVEMESKVVKLKNGAVINAKIWDTSGHEKYKALTSAHYSQSTGALLFFDLTNLYSFRDSTEWISEIREKAGDV